MKILDRAFMVLYPFLTAVVLFVFASQFENFQIPVTGDPAGNSIMVVGVFIFFSIVGLGFAVWRYTTTLAFSTLFTNMCVINIAIGSTFGAITFFVLALISIAFNFLSFFERQSLEKSIEDYRASATPHIGM